MSPQGEGLLMIGSQDLNVCINQGFFLNINGIVIVEFESIEPNVVDVLR